MKKLLFLILALTGASYAQAFSASGNSVTSTALTVTGAALKLDFMFIWTTDDAPRNSAPGKLELVNGGGTVVALLTGSVYKTGGVSLNIEGTGLTSNVNSWAGIFCPNGAPADAKVSGTWLITGLSPGNYTLRKYNYVTTDSIVKASSVWTNSTAVVSTANVAPSIAWTATPGTVASGQTYTVSVHGHDQDWNLVQVNIWKNGNPFAFGGGGNGLDGDSQNPSSDSGPQTVTFTAQAVDAAGAVSAVISQTVNVQAPPAPPTIAWTLTPGTVESSQSYTVAAHGHDSNGDLTQVNIWRNGAPFAFAGGGNGTDGDSQNPSSETGPGTVTYTAQAVDAGGRTSGVISQVVTVRAPNRAPTISWTEAPGSVAHGQTYTIAARGHDVDGNLTAVTVWKNGGTFASGGAGNGTDSDAQNPSSDSGPASVTYTAQAVDAKGERSAVITQVVSVGPPYYTLTVSAPAGLGSVSGGGTYAAGTVVTLTASASASYDFAGWSGDAAGSANPLAVTVDRNKAVSAAFALKNFPLSTGNAGGGGSVTPGGIYPAGTIVTITAAPDATHRFMGWSGDASGAAPSIAVTVDRAKAVQANFALKTAQTITFAPLADLLLAGAPFGVMASADSGLPVSFAVVSGPALLTGNVVRVTGPGAVTIQAVQAGDDVYLPATPVNRSFNVIAPVILKYAPAGRTLLDRAKAPNGTPLLVPVP